MKKFSLPQTQGQTTSLPTFYVIAGQAEDVSFPERVALAPPDLLHIGRHEVPFKSMLGAVAGYNPWDFQPLTPAEVKKRIAHLTSYVAALHQAGVKVVIPYICDQTIFGDHETRAGFWRFYDHWEDYGAFGFTDKPEQDPLEWMQRDQKGNLTLRKNLAKLFTEYRLPLKPEEMEQAKSFYRYRPCPNNDSWRRYLLTVVENIVRCGYDGLFVDNNVIRCYGKCCQEKFQAYLKRKYSARQLRGLFGFKEVKDVRLGAPWEGLLWVETQKFRAESIVELLRLLKAKGEGQNPKDFGWSLTGVPSRTCKGQTAAAARRTMWARGGRCATS